MSGPLKSDSEEMRAVAGLINSVVEEMRSEFEKLTARGDELAEGWVGVSGSKYRAPWEEWKRGGKAVIDALEGESGLLDESAAEYDRQESENKQGFGQVEARLNF
ncbi:WXG100 family type VII secretion target [Segniliparus rugosus]|uniref:ESAT-6-like protein n=1 Tax=Segniliparus rugosus (strain ATCC BAA-974 / DSM 45345 / CCUG 50838 / CIP 108380 / JCM 13579 / CDC 945) TaxID=679197 RepID=E5XNS4_SEGRC|nr:WXG100 family type VII secretion target [Segniliparus rugosus]EFV13994.1 WXG100 family type VII secretion target [Segniliparus rugosus ATCC BAA-974]